MSARSTEIGVMSERAGYVDSSGQLFGLSLWCGCKYRTQFVVVRKESSRKVGKPLCYTS